MGEQEGAIELTGKIMVVAIIFLFFILVFLFCLHLYAKWFWYRRQENTTAAAATTRRRRLDFATGHQEITLVSALHGGLNPSLLKTIPIIAFHPKDCKDGLLECAVCLCEFSEGEKTRVLPKCTHGFHVECIDMWFQSHSTCPLCRNPVLNHKQQMKSCSTGSTLEDILEEAPSVENPNGGFNSMETPSFPTNVLFWGDETRVIAFGPCVEEDHSSSSSSSSMSNRVDVMLVIDVPRQTNDEEEEKSPIPTGLRSLKRLLISGGGRIRGNSSSSRNMDLEEGGGKGQS